MYIFKILEITIKNIGKLLYNGNIRKLRYNGNNTSKKTHPKNMGGKRGEKRKNVFHVFSTVPTVFYIPEFNRHGRRRRQPPVLVLQCRYILL
jgi:hypothetical protein